MTDAFRQRPYPVLLKPAVQHYAWGETEFIPELLGIDNEVGRPFAELWMGAHGQLPSEALIGDQRIALDALFDADGERLLGERVASRFGRLPYLFKVLAAARPLSIQVHPSKRQAEDGFARENEAAVPLDAAHRNYKDDNHKPELILAVSDFYALRGFRPFEEIARIREEAPELSACFELFEPTSEGLGRLFRHLMSLSQRQVDTLLSSLIERLRAENAAQPFASDDRRFWVLTADREYSTGEHRDRGLFAVYLLNFVCLRAGEAAFLPAGILHAYLRGVGVELMANSDNVLRCGLTPKHVDVPELMKTVRFVGGPPESTEPVRASNSGEWIYPTPAEEFELRRLELTPGESYRGRAEHSAEIHLVLELDPEASLSLASSEASLSLRRGSVFLIPYGVDYSLEATGPTIIYKAVVPA